MAFPDEDTPLEAQIGLPEGAACLAPSWRKAVAAYRNFTDICKTAHP